MTQQVVPVSFVGDQQAVVVGKKGVRRQPFCVNGQEAQPWAISCWSHCVARAWCMCAASSRAQKIVVEHSAHGLNAVGIVQAIDQLVTDHDPAWLEGHAPRGRGGELVVGCGAAPPVSAWRIRREMTLPRLMFSARAISSAAIKRAQSKSMVLRIACTYLLPWACCQIPDQHETSASMKMPRSLRITGHWLDILVHLLHRNAQPHAGKLHRVPGLVGVQHPVAAVVAPEHIDA